MGGCATNSDCGCNDCGTVRGVAAAQRLQFGLIAAVARPGVGTWWQANLAAGYVTDWRGTPSDPVTDYVEGLLREREADLGVSIGGVAANMEEIDLGAESWPADGPALSEGYQGHAVGAEEWGADDPGPGTGKGEEQAGKIEKETQKKYKNYKPLDGPENDSPPPGESFTSGRCCVKKFEFPTPGTSYGLYTTGKGNMIFEHLSTHPINRETVKHPFFLFSVLAEYIPGEALSGCACVCCQFRQYVVKDEMIETPTWGKAADRKSRKTPPAFLGQDCYWYVVDMKARHGRRVAGRTKPALKKTEKAYGPFCAGDVAGGEREGGRLKKDSPFRFSSGTAGTISPDQCIFTFTDHPSNPVGVGYKFTWDLDFLGVIHDACHHWVPRRMKLMKLHMEGTLGTLATPPKALKATLNGQKLPRLDRTMP